MAHELAQATLAGGCFWCLEAAFEAVPGVESVTSGYAGGDLPEPAYEQVTTGETGHAECVQIEYDPEQVSYLDLLGTFFRIHDPTQLNRQGPDVGSQYRSAIFTHDQTQRETAEELITALGEQDAYDGPIVTEVEPLETFWPAEDYHQNYYEKNPGDGYCTLYVEPKVQKVRASIAEADGP